MRVLVGIALWLCCAVCAAQIAAESFENSSTFTISNGAYYSGSSGAGDRPATSPFAVAGTYAYGCTNTTVTMTSPVYNTSCYSSVAMSLRLAAFSIASTGNGMDLADNVKVYVSTDGGSTFNSYLEVYGNNNAYWAYSATGVASTAYPTVTTYTPGGGGSRTADGYSTLTITSLPAISNLVIRIVMINNSANERWVLDDFQLTGTFIGCNSITSGSVSPTTFTLDCSNAQSGTVTFTSSGTFNAGNVYSAQLSDANGSFALPTTVGTLTSTANSGTITITIPLNTPSGTGYQIQVVSGNPAVTGSATSSFTITNSCTIACPSLTGAILNGCDNATAGCNEGDTEILFFNTGTYSVSVSTLSSGVVTYYGSTTSYTNGTADASTGTFSSNATITSTLNSSTGCSGSFIDAASAGTIPAGATVMMVPNNFCSVNYDFSAICANFSPIYVLYFGTTSWSSTGNLANNQTPGPKPKYLEVDFSSAAGACGPQFYTYDAYIEANGNGAGVAYSSVSTNSASPVSPVSYTGTGCALPMVLPVDLLSFSARLRTADETEISFTTIREEHLGQFIVSKSYDGLIYEPCAAAPAHNLPVAKSYIVYDRLYDTDAAVVYYRLEEEDLNGARKAIGYALLELRPSEEMQVLYDAGGVVIKSPVPLQRIALRAADGRLLAEGNGEEDTLTYSLSLQHLPGGFYLLTVTQQGGRIYTFKIIR